MTQDELEWYLTYLDEQNHWNYDDELKDSRQRELDYLRNKEK